MLQVTCLFQQKGHTTTFDFIASFRLCFFPLQQHNAITTITTTTTITTITIIIVVLDAGSVGTTVGASVGATVGVTVEGVGGNVVGASVGLSAFSMDHHIHPSLPVSITKRNFVETVLTVRITENTLNFARSSVDPEITPVDSLSESVDGSGG